MHRYDTNYCANHLEYARRLSYGLMSCLAYTYSYISRSWKPQLLGAEPSLIPAEKTLANYFYWRRMGEGGSMYHQYMQIWGFCRLDSFDSLDQATRLSKRLEGDTGSLRNNEFIEKPIPAHPSCRLDSLVALRNIYLLLFVIPETPCIPLQSLW